MGTGYYMAGTRTNVKLTKTCNQGVLELILTKVLVIGEY